MDDAVSSGEVDVDRLSARLRVQGRTAGQLGSPLYTTLLTGAAEDVAVGGPCRTVLGPYAHEPDAAAVPLRFMAAVHRLVLRRQAPALALHYPSVGGQAGPEGAWTAFRDAVEAHAEELVALTGLPCQTNEVGRSAALAPALLWVQGRFDMPLHHLEIGTSAGLNLRWDHFRYGTADQLRSTWGPRDSPVDLTGHWQLPPTNLPRTADVRTRRGCDPSPGDPGSADTREGLTAAIWPDQHDRHRRLAGALAIAGEVPAEVVTARAGSWLGAELAARPAGAATVVSHSVVWRYLPASEQAQVIATFEAHGADATPDRPLAWVRLEPTPPLSVYDGTPYPVTATTWPGGRTRVLGHAQAHGQDLRWAA